MKTMRKVLILMALAAASFSVSSCDFFRSLVGRPTSEWIAEKEARIKADEELLRMVEEEIAAATDSLGADSTAVGSLPVAEVPATTGTPESGCRYYIIVGVFSNTDNARKLADRAKAGGYDYRLIDWPGAMTAVALCPTNDLEAANSSLRTLSAEPFCPKDIWILDTNRRR